MVIVVITLTRKQPLTSVLTVSDTMQEDDGNNNNEVEELSKSIALRMKDPSSAGKLQQKQEAGISGNGEEQKKEATESGTKNEEEEEVNIDGVDDGEIVIDYGE